MALTSAPAMAPVPALVMTLALAMPLALSLTLIGILALIETLALEVTGPRPVLVRPRHAAPERAVARPLSRATGRPGLVGRVLIPRCVRTAIPWGP